MGEARAICLLLVSAAAPVWAQSIEVDGNQTGQCSGPSGSGPFYEWSCTGVAPAQMAPGSFAVRYRGTPSGSATTCGSKAGGVNPDGWMIQLAPANAPQSFSVFMHDTGSQCTVGDSLNPVQGANAERRWVAVGSLQTELAGPGNTEFLGSELHDDGLFGDAVAGDGIFTFRFLATSPYLSAPWQVASFGPVRPLWDRDATLRLGSSSWAWQGAASVDPLLLGAAAGSIVTLEADLEHGTAQASVRPRASHVIISRVQLRGTGNNNDEWIELHNPTLADIDMSGWSLWRRGAGASTCERKLFVGGNVIRAGGYFLVANNAAPECTPTPIADMCQATVALPHTTGSTIFVVNTQPPANGPCPPVAANVVDKVGWGTSTNLDAEGSPSPSPVPFNTSTDFHIARNGFGETDSDDNAADFTAASPEPSPRGTSSPPSLPYSVSHLVVYPAFGCGDITLSYFLHDLPGGKTATLSALRWRKNGGSFTPGTALGTVSGLVRGLNIVAWRSRLDDANGSGTYQVELDFTVDNQTVTAVSSPFDLDNNGSCPIAGLVLSEIQRSPSGGGAEWIEITNTTVRAVDLKGHAISDGTTVSEITRSVVVPSGGRIVLAADDNPLTNGGIVGAVRFGALSFASTGHAQLQRPNRTAASSLDVNARTPIPGYAEALCHPQLDNSGAESFCPSTTLYGSAFNYGTPGAANDCSLSTTIPANDAFLQIGRTRTYAASVKTSCGGELFTIPAWTSDNGGVATVNSAGVVTATGAGSTQIHASFLGVSGATTVKVTAIERISVTPSLTLRPGESATVTATALDKNDETLPMSFAWSSASPSVATIDANGLVTALAKGVTTVGAGAESVSGSTMVTVLRRLATTLEATPTAFTLTKNDTRTIALKAFDAVGTEVVDGAVVWSSDDDSVALVEDGNVTAVGRGVAHITATVEQATITIEVTVIDPVVTVELVPAEATITVGQHATFRATLLNRDGDLVSGVPVEWTLEGDPIASVDGNGIFTALSPGTAQVVATAEGQRASGALTVVSGSLVLSGHATLAGRTAFAATRVSVEGTGLTAETDTIGYYRIAGLGRGDYTVAFSHDRFASQRVRVHLEGDLTVDVTLEEAAGEGGGCACETTGRGRVDGSLLLGLVLACWASRRRRRRV